MTAIGTVAMSVSNVGGCRLADTLAVGARLARVADARTSSARTGIGRGTSIPRGLSRGDGSGGPAARDLHVRPRAGRAGRAPLIGTTMATVISGPSVRLRVDLLGRLDARTAAAGPSGSPAATPRRSSRCSCWPAGRAPGRRSPPTCGRTRTGHPPGRCARRSGWSGRASPTPGSAPGPSSTSRRTRSGSGWMRRSTSTSTGSRRCPTDDACGAEAAVELYHGDLLEGLGHDCFAAERERLSDRFEDALAIVAERRLADGDVAGAQAAADRLLERDPLREEAHAVLIAVHGLIGSRSQVVRQYRRLHDVLRARARRDAAARHRGDLPPGARPDHAPGDGTGGGARCGAKPAAPGRPRLSPGIRAGRAGTIRAPGTSFGHALPSGHVRHPVRPRRRPGRRGRLFGRIVIARRRAR